jgi:hypothetical protein
MDPFQQQRQQQEQLRQQQEIQRRTEESVRRQEEVFREDQRRFGQEQLASRRRPGRHRHRGRRFLVFLIFLIAIGAAVVYVLSQIGNAPGIG